METATFRPLRGGENQRELTRIDVLHQHGLNEDDCSPQHHHDGGPGARERTWYEILKEESLGTIAILVMMYAGFSYNAIFLGRILPAAGKDGLVPYYAVAYNIALVLTLWSWVQAHVEDPGSIPPRWHEFVATVGNSLCVAPVRRQWQPGFATYCRSCGVLRPERTHHCRQCNMCVLRMDHHCPFIKNCVGFNNHKYFLLLLTYGFASSVVGLVTAAPQLMQITTELVRWDGVAPWIIKGVRPSDAMFFVGFGGVAIAVMMLFQPMLLFHYPSAAYNQSQLENGYDNMPNPYNLGTTMGNLSQIFGTPGLDWVLPIRPFRPLSDGVAYRRGDVDFGEEGLHMKLMQNGQDPEKLWRIRYRVPLRDDNGMHAIPGPTTVCSGCLV